MLNPDTIDAIKAEATRMTYERARAEAMGFKFSDIEVVAGSGLFDEVRVLIRGTLTCVCGRRERFQNEFGYSPQVPLIHALERVNVARELVRLGAFTREHLLGDGYTPEQCDEIEQKGRRFDQECQAATQRLQNDDFRRERERMMRACNTR